MRKRQPRLDITLHLETLRSSPTTSTFKLPSLAFNVWFLVLMWAHAEMFNGFSCFLWSSQQNNIASSWVFHGELINCHARASGSLNSCSSSCCESQSGDVEFRDFEHAVVICDGTDDADCLSLVCFLCCLGGDFAVNSRNGHGRSVDSRHVEAAEDNLVELCICAAFVTLAIVRSELVRCACTYERGSGRA